jgi:hypothetical protein
MVGMVRRWASVESWAGAAKLGVIRELIRREDNPWQPTDQHVDMPDAWSESLTHELALALASSVGSADRIAWLAWELGNRLPGIDGLLTDGTLTYGKAKAVAEAFQHLSDADAAHAEALILGQLAGKTYLQVLRLAAAAAAKVDPEGDERRRKDAEQHAARVRLWREQSGAAALAGFDLPTDEALAAHANVSARAEQYLASGAFPDAKMDQLRAMAYLDLLNSVTVEARIANSFARAGSAGSSDSGTTSDDPQDVRDRDYGTTSDDPEQAPDRGPDDDPDDDSPRSGDPRDRGPDNRGPGEGGPDGSGPDGSDPGAGSGNGSPGGDPDNGPGDGPSNGDSGGGSPDDGPDDAPGGDPDGSQLACHIPESGPEPASEPASRPRTDLVIPLATLLGLGNRPGEDHRLGPLDPVLCRDLAIVAANSPATEFCVTVTDLDGIAVGHGCARIPRRAPARSAEKSGVTTEPGAMALAELPARVNLTISQADLRSLSGPASRGSPVSQDSLVSQDSPVSRGSPWAFTPHAGGPPTGSHTPADGYGIWTLTMSHGREFTVRLESVPTFECDHAHESHAYQANDTLRHLVQIRDGDCTFPSCTRHARESDFEHAVPYDQGGRTCSCNAGARSRRCHRIKQSAGWNVTQPKPGFHRWETPVGRTYTQEPKRYPV